MCVWSGSAACLSGGGLSRGGLEVGGGLSGGGLKAGGGLQVKAPSVMASPWLQTHVQQEQHIAVHEARLCT